jgi:hypothetical protein
MSSSARTRPRPKVKKPYQVRTVHTEYKGVLSDSKVLSLERVLGAKGRLTVENVLKSESQWEKQNNTYLRTVSGESLPSNLRDAGIQEVQVLLLLQGNASQVETRAKFSTRVKADAQSLRESAMVQIEHIANLEVNRVLARSLVNEIRERVRVYTRQPVTVKVENNLVQRVTAHINHMKGF